MNQLLACQYYVTYRCNSQCYFCNIWKRDSKEQSFDTLYRNLKDLRRLGVRIIDFTGGEPLLYPYIVEAYSSSKKLGFRTALTTNGLLYPKFGLKLKGLVDILNISFDTLNREKYFKIRGVDALNKVLEAVDYARKIREKIYLLKTVTPEDFDELDDLVKFAQAKRVTLKINPVFVYFNLKVLKCDKTLSERIIKKVRKLSKEPYVIVDLAHYKFIEEGGNNIEKPVCNAVKKVITISPDNKLVLPCFHKKTREIPIENNLYDLYYSKGVQDEINKAGRYDFCQGCYINCYFRYSLYDKPRFWLEILKSVKKQIIEHYIRR